MEEMAGRIQARMREMGMVNPQGDPNVKELEARTKLGYATVQGLVRGDKNNPTLSTIVKLAKGLRVSVDWLLGSDAFDVRAYEQGREAVAKAVTKAVEKTLAAPVKPRPPQASPDAPPDDVVDAGDANPVGSDAGRSEA